jgi:hypothetical protein
MKGLLIKQPYIDWILEGEKTWEVRGSNTKIRGKIKLIQSGSGLIVGECEIIDSIALTQDLFEKSKNKHHSTLSFEEISYKNPYAWEIKNAKRYEKSIPYIHQQGAIIWVNL